MEELYVVCRISDIKEGEAAGFVLMQVEEGGEPKAWPILVRRKGDRIYGYENTCPHQRGRLDASPGQFLDKDGKFISCGKHHAQFDLDTGECFMGPCQGERLTPITVVIDDDDVCVTGVRLVEEDGANTPNPACVTK